MAATLKSEKGLTKIKVVTVRRDLIDIAQANEDELTSVCEAIFSNENYQSSKNGFTDAILSIGRLYRSAYGSLLEEPQHNKTPNSIDAILLRELLANTDIYPVTIDERFNKGFGEPSIIVRAPSTIQAFDITGQPVAYAAEDPMTVVGLAMAPQDSGMSLALALFGQSREYGIESCVQSGSYTSATFAIMMAKGQWPIEMATASGPTAKKISELLPKGFLYCPFNGNFKATILASLAQTRAAVDFYLSGAAAALSAASITAALQSKTKPSRNPQAPASRVYDALNQIEAIAAFVKDTNVDVANYHDSLPVQQRRQYLLDRLSQIFDISTDLIYRLSALNEIWNAGASDAYLAVLTEGRDSARVAAYLERLSTAVTKRVAALELAAANSKRMSHARLLVTIVEEKLGSKKMQQIVRALGAVARGAPGGRLAQFEVSTVALNEPLQVLELLTKNERRLVETEAKNRLAAFIAVEKNKCLHVRLVRRMNMAQTVQERAHLLGDLVRVYFPANYHDSLPANYHDSLPANYHDSLPTDAKKQSASKKAAANADHLSYIVCRSCGEDIICPHRHERILLEAKGASYAKVRAHLEKYALRTGGNSDAYYCRICAEQLALADSESDETGRTAQLLGRFGELGAGLRTRIWSITINALRRVSFAVPTDERRFAGEAATTLIPLIDKANENAQQQPRRTNRRSKFKEPALSNASELREELSPRIELLCAIFSYAYILDALQGRSAPSTFAGGRAGERASVTADRMLSIIANEMGSQIAQLEDVSTDYLRVQFTEAYKAIHSSDKPEAALDIALEFATMMMTIDPVYRYAVSIARAIGDLPLEPATTTSDTRKEFELVMGASLPTLLARARAAAKKPALVGLFAGRPGLSIPLGTIYEFWLKEPDVSLYTDDMYYWSSGDVEKHQKSVSAFYSIEGGGESQQDSLFAYILEKEGGRVLKQHNDKKSALKTISQKFHVKRPVDAPEMGAFYEAWRLLVEYTTKVYTADAQDKFMSELLRYRKAESAMLLEKSYGMVRPEADPPVGKSQRFHKVPVSINALYDENGLSHNWGKAATFYYKGSKNTSIDDTTKSTDPVKEYVYRHVDSVMKARMSGELPEGVPLVDVGCAVCGLRQSELHRLDTDKIKIAVRTDSELVSFYLFYETRCPLGGVHDWRGACTKCGLEPALLQAIRSAAARSYYTKYAEMFAKERSLSALTMQQSNKYAAERDKKEIKEAAAKATADDTSPISHWVFDYSQITDAAALANTTPAVLEAVGAAAGREFNDIVEGRDPPGPPESPADPRIYIADSTARTMFAHYHALRSSASTTLSVNLLAEAGMDNQKEAIAQLPDLEKDYCKNFAVILKTRTPADALNFAIQSYCAFANTLAAVSPLGKLIAKKALENVILGVRRMSRPGVFDWAIFSGERDLIEEEEGAPDQIGDVGEDVEAPNDDANLYSGENIDYDVSEDNPNNQAE